MTAKFSCWLLLFGCWLLGLINWLTLSQTIQPNPPQPPPSAARLLLSAGIICLKLNKGLEGWPGISSISDQNYTDQPLLILHNLKNLQNLFLNFFHTKPFIFEENMKGKVGSFFPPETNILYENIISFKLLTRHGIYSGINS